MPSITLPDGRTLNLFITGTGTPVVLLHGYLDSHKSFFRLFEALGATHKLYAPDQRGHGDSAPAPDYAVSGFVADAIALLEALTLGPVHLGGHSLGGIVAQRVAESRPDLVKSLALISTARTAHGNAALLDAAPLLAALDSAVPPALAREFQASTSFTTLPADIFQTYLDETAKVSLDVWQRALHGLVADNHDTSHPPQHPTLIIWGAKDGLFTITDQHTLRAAYPNATWLTLPETGHAPNWERPEQTAQALLAFWAAHA
jgi:pimeloyl-ACP methyl ester carboxylesterase